MEVLFAADGKETLRVSTPIPPAGVDLGEFLHGYAPFGQWEQPVVELANLSPGTTGVFTPAAAAPVEAAPAPSTTPQPDAMTQAMIDAAVQRALAASGVV